MHRKGRVFQSEQTARHRQDDKVHRENWELKVQLQVWIRKSVEGSGERGLERWDRGYWALKQAEKFFFIFRVKRSLYTILLRELGQIVGEDDTIRLCMNSLLCILPLLSVCIIFFFFIFSTHSFSFLIVEETSMSHQQGMSP